MVVNKNELLNAVAILADNQNMRVTVKQSGKGSLVCGAACFVGGLLAGPVGLAVGGTAGGIGAYMITRDKFRSVGDIIRNDLTAPQQEQLAAHLRNFCQQLETRDAQIIVSILMANQGMQVEVMRIVSSYLMEELQLKITN